MRHRIVSSTPVRPAGGPDISHLGSSPSRVQSVDRAVLLLRAVAAAGGDGAATTALGDACGLNRATAWRLLWTLETHGMVVHDRARGRWRLGATVLDLAREAGLDAVLDDVRGVLETLALQTGETAAVAVLQGGELTYVEEATPPAAVAVSWVGRPISLHATSTGKVLLAWSSPAEVDALLGESLASYTGSTVTERRALLAELEVVRARGYATCAGEYDAAAWGVSAPVLGRDGRLVAVLSIWGPSSRVPPERFPVLGEVALAAASRLAGG